MDNKPGGSTIIGTDLLAKAAPGKLNYAPIGDGSAHHLLVEWLKGHGARKRMDSRIPRMSQLVC